MSFFKKKNAMLIAGASLMLLAIGTCAVSTMAWFTTSSYPATPANVTSGSPEITLGKTYGYANIGGNTVREYEVGKAATNENENNEAADWSFDIPTGGMGYYLIPEDSQGQFKYANGLKMFEYGSNDTIGGNRYEGAGKEALSSFASVTTSLTVNKRYQLRTYQCENLRTVNRTINLENLTVPSGETESNVAIIDSSKEFFTAKSEDSYTIWIDFVRGSLGFEKASSIGEANRRSLKTGLRRGKAENNIPTAPSDQKLIYFTNNKGWANVYCHYWGGSSSTSWPGTKMSFLYKNSSNEDVYYISVPSNTQKVVFHKNESGNQNQTVDIALSTHNAFYITSQTGDQYTKWNAGTWDVVDNTYKFYNIKQGANSALFPTPYAYGFYEHPTSKDVVRNGTFPGATMASTAEDNVYSITLPSYIETIIFSNGTGSSQTVNVSLKDNVDKYFVVTGGSGSSLTGEWYSSISPEGEDVTYFLYDPNQVMGSSASTHYCYYWCSTKAYIRPAWPGVQMTAVNNEPNLYKVTFSSTFDKLIFNNNNTVQTGNLDKNETKKYYVLGSDASNVTNYLGIKADVSSDTQDLYVYDIDGLFDGTPYGYAYLINDGTNDYYYKTTQNAAWPGSLTTAQTTYQVDEETIYTDVTGLYKISVSVDFTHIIFNNGQNAYLPGSSTPNPDSVQMSDAASEIPEDKSYFVLDSTQKDTSETVVKYGGTWSDALSILTFEAQYFIKDTDDNIYPLSFTPVDLGRDVSSATSTYNPEENEGLMGRVAAVDQYITDEDEGILYHFEPEADVWYKESPSGAYTLLPIEHGNVNGISKLVKRMICDVDDLQTFYVDVSNTGDTDEHIWQSINVYPFVNDSPILSGNDLAHGGASDFRIQKKIATNLYRVTIPKSLVDTTGSGVIINNYNYSQGNNQTTNIDAGPMSEFLTIKRNGTNSANWFWCTRRNCSIGTATIKIAGYSDVQMQVGDIYQSNWFIYEQALDFSEGANRSVTIQVAPTAFGEALGIENKTYGYSDIYGTAPSYVHNGDGNAALVANGARYTFYIGNKANKENRSYLAIAQVPSKGNGFYFMKANSGDAATANTDSFANGFKMKSIGSDSASYTGYTVTAADVAAHANHLYFRSYLHAVDLPYESIDISRLTNGEATVTTSAEKPAIVTLKAGKYSFSISGGTVIIALYQQEEWTLLDPPNATVGSPNIKDQHLSRVLRVEFNVESAQAVKIGLEISNPLSGYVGCSFFVSSVNMGLDCYSYMRDNYYTLSNESYLEFDGLTILGGDESTYYAYILIDFTTKEVPSIPPGQLSFALRCTQQVAN